MKERLGQKRGASAHRSRSLVRKSPEGTPKTKANPAPRKKFDKGETVYLESEDEVDDQGKPKRGRALTPKRKKSESPKTKTLKATTQNVQHKHQKQN